MVSARSSGRVSGPAASGPGRLTPCPLGGGNGALPSLRSIREIAFYLGLGSLFTHELDAVPNHEWRGLPLLGTLPDETGMWVFIAAHVPLFAILKRWSTE